MPTTNSPYFLNAPRTVFVWAKQISKRILWRLQYIGIPSGLCHTKVELQEEYCSEISKQNWVKESVICFVITTRCSFPIDQRWYGTVIQAKTLTMLDAGIRFWQYFGGNYEEWNLLLPLDRCWSLIWRHTTCANSRKIYSTNRTHRSASDWCE